VGAAEKSTEADASCLAAGAPAGGWCPLARPLRCGPGAAGAGAAPRTPPLAPAALPLSGAPAPPAAAPLEKVLGSLLPLPEASLSRSCCVREVPPERPEAREVGGSLELVTPLMRPEPVLLPLHPDCAPVLRLCADRLSMLLPLPSAPPAVVSTPRCDPEPNPNPAPS